VDSLHSYLLNKSVAVVGNGKLHPMAGKAIDSHDVVLKFNNGVRFSNPSSFGKRCDVLVSAQLNPMLQNDAYLKANPKYFVRWGKDSISEYLKDKAIYLDDAISKNEVSEQMNTSMIPTTGACFLTWLTRVNCDVTLFGFDHLKNPNWYDTRKKQIGTTWHDSKAEERYIDSLGYKHYKRESLGIPLMFCQRRNNAGDMASGYMYEKITGHKPEALPLSSKHEIKHFAGIGSIIGWCNSNSHVWGSGMISDDSLPYGNPKFYAVRGQHTRNNLIEAGHSVPKVYGDPALLLPDFYPCEVKPEYDFAIIPHYADKGSTLFNNYIGMRNAHVIDIQQNIETLIHAICSASVVISSSLHALIFADAYGVPAYWIRSNRVVGRGFKFYDYFSSIGQDYTERMIGIKADIRRYPKLDHYDVSQKIQKLKEGLYESCPY